MFSGGLRVHNLCLNMSEVISTVQGHKERKVIPWTALMHKICPRRWKMVAATNQVHPPGWKSIKTTLQVRLSVYLIYQPLLKRRCQGELQGKYAVALLQNSLPHSNKLHFNDFSMWHCHVLNSRWIFCIDGQSCYCWAQVRYLLFQEAWRFTFLMHTFFC